MSALNETPFFASARGLWVELKQRRVPRMAAWYVGVVFVALQGAGFIVEYFAVPAWTVRAMAALAVVAFPLTLVLSWYFEITPDGHLQRDPRAGPFREEWRIIVTGFVVATSAVLAAFVAPLVPDSRATTHVICSDGSAAPCTRAFALEPNRFVVLPLVHTGHTAPELDGEICARLITEGLLHWQDINVVDPARVHDELNRLPAELRKSMPFDTAIAVAQRLGAGKLITGQLWELNHVTRVDAFLYDVATRAQLQRAHTRYDSDSTDAEREFHQLAARFVADPVDRSRAATATNSVAAMQARDSALLRVAVWDLAGARVYFEKALQRDPNYPHAHLGLAEVLLWKGDTSEVWRTHAERAFTAAESLDGQTRLLALGMGHLAKKRYAEACAAYRDLIERDALNFYGWFGLGECLRRDDRVVADATSPSGWSFVSSWQAAIAAHKRALALVPSFHAAFVHLGSSQLEQLLFLSVTESRPGVAADTMRFAAWPDLQGDTLALVPYPYADWRTQQKPPSVHVVVQRHRNEWAETVTRWAELYPDNPHALEAAAWTLELSGHLLPADRRSNSALGLLRRARRLAADSSGFVRLAAAETRVLFKAHRFREARQVALKALRDYDQPGARDALLLGGLAGLTGRTHEMARLLVLGADSTDHDTPLTGERVEVPAPLARATAALLAYAYAGAPIDSIRRFSRSAHEALARFTPPHHRTLMHQTGLDRAARMVFPLVGADDAHRRASDVGPFIREQAALARGDTGVVRAALNAVDAYLHRQAPTDFASDGVLTYTQLRLAIGDTAAAVSALDAYLNDLANLPRGHFRQPYQPMSAVRLMALRADLAAVWNERAAARKWSRAVLDLWHNSDRDLRPMLQRMRAHSRL